MSELKEKICQVLKDPQVMTLATLTAEGRPWARYIVGAGDKDCTIRFTTFLGSRKVAQIRKNPEVHILCGVTTLETAERYLQIQARAEISTDAAVKKEMWNDYLKDYFSGPDDPNYCVGIVRPYRIEYMAMGSREPEVWEA